MAIPISRRTDKLLNTLFDSAQAAIIRLRFMTDVADNIPYCETASSEDMERIRFAILKMALQNFRYLDNAVQRAKVDWRDLLVIAEFVDRDAHLQWYEEVSLEYHANFTPVTY